VTSTARRLALVVATTAVISAGSLGAVRAATPAPAPAPPTTAATVPVAAVCAGIVVADLGLCL
jgi:hypothetical protein